MTHIVSRDNERGLTFEAHLAGVLSWLAGAVSKKYREGQRQHGGELWRKRGMLAHVEAEMLDLTVYVPTLRAQLCDITHLMRDGEHGQAYQKLLAILGEAEE